MKKGYEVQLNSKQAPEENTVEQCQHPKKHSRHRMTGCHALESPLQFGPVPLQALALSYLNNCCVCCVFRTYTHCFATLFLGQPKIL